MPADPRAHCHSCNGIHLAADMHPVEAMTAKQTRWSPAEYDDVHVCEACFNGDGPDEDYERAQASEAWQRRGGGGL